MKYLFITISFLFSLNAFAQGQQKNLIIDPGQSKNKQHIGISSNGRELLSNERREYGEHEIKGHFKSWLLTDFADALKEYMNIDEMISDSLASVGGGGFFTSSTATGNTVQDADDNDFLLDNGGLVEIFTYDDDGYIHLKNESTLDWVTEAAVYPYETNVITGHGLYGYNGFIADTNMARIISPEKVVFGNHEGTPTDSAIVRATEIYLDGNVTISGQPKIYRALVSQTGTDDPVATVLENTLGGAVVWSRSGDGTYMATATDLLGNAATFYMQGSIYRHAVSGELYSVSYGSHQDLGGGAAFDQFQLLSYSYANMAALDGDLDNVPVEFYVY